MHRQILHTRFLSVAFLVGALVLVGCERESSNGGAPSDPGAPGPYAVGELRRTIVRPATVSGEERVLDTVIWYPARRERGAVGDALLVPRADAEPSPDGPFPVLIFSHGSGGLPEQSLALTSHLVSHGFVVAAPPHPGNTLRDCSPCLDLASVSASLRERPDDVRAALDELYRLNEQANSPLRGRIAVERAGVIGHSLGGSTALLAAARDPRLRAVLPLAPAIFPDVQAAASGLTVPVLAMNGDADFLTSLARTRRMYEALPGAVSHGLVTILGGDHLVFVRPHAGVQRYAAAFARLVLNDDAAMRAVFDPNAPAPGTRLEQVGLH